MKARWVFFCRGREFRHDRALRFTRHLLFITASCTVDVLSPIRRTPGENLPPLLAVCDWLVILQLCHSGDLWKTKSMLKWGIIHNTVWFFNCGNIFGVITEGELLSVHRQKQAGIWAAFYFGPLSFQHVSTESLNSSTYCVITCECVLSAVSLCSSQVWLFPDQLPRKDAFRESDLCFANQAARS